MVLVIDIADMRDEAGPDMRSSSKIIVYSKARTGMGSKLQKAVDTILPGANVETFHAVSRLSERLRRPALNFPIVVLLVTSREELNNLLAIKELLLDVRVLLILPDKENDTMVLGHTLRPRFVSFRDSSFTDVVAVLGKMVNRSLRVKAQDYKGGHSYYEC
jgi:hypothetical protein